MSILDLIKRYSFQLDMNKTYTESRINDLRAKIALYEGSNNRKDKKAFVRAKLRYERFVVYLEELEQERINLFENISLLLDKHKKRYKEVFIGYYLENKSKSEIAVEMGYSVEAVEKMINDIEYDLNCMYESAKKKDTQEN